MGEEHRRQLDARAASPTKARISSVGNGPQVTEAEATPIEREVTDPGRLP